MKFVFLAKLDIYFASIGTLTTVIRVEFPNRKYFLAFELLFSHNNISLFILTHIIAHILCKIHQSSYT